MRREPRNVRGSWLIGPPVCAVLLATTISFAYERLTAPEQDVHLAGSEDAHLASSEDLRLAGPEDPRLGDSFELRWRMFPEPITPSTPAPNPPLPETQPSTIEKNEPASLAPVPGTPTKLTETARIPQRRRAGRNLPRSRQAHRHRSLNVTRRSTDEISLSANSSLPQICLPPFFLLMSPQELRACGMLPLDDPPAPRTSVSVMY